ncbi:MAG: TetR/AcrR family transcriptional regulator [Planctomycetota bacterium]
MTVEEYRQRITATNRAAIRDAAVAAFLENGYERASMEDIAKRADVSTATLYKHATSKSTLFGWVLAAAWSVDDESAIQKLTDMLQGPPDAVLRAAGRHYADSLCDVKVVSLFRVIIAEGQRFPEIGEDLYNLAKRPYLECIERYLIGATEEGVLSVDDPAGAARQFLGMINDQVFWPRLLVAGFRAGPKARDSVVREAVVTFLARFGARR